MTNFLSSLPAILGIIGFVIYFLLKKSVTRDPIISSIIDKVRKESPEISHSLEGLDNKQKERLLKSDIKFRNALSQDELRVLDNAMHRQFKTIIFVYSLCGFLLLTGIGLYIYQLSKPKVLGIDNIQIQDTDSTARKILVDLDPVTVTWTTSGRDEEVYVALENAATGQQTKKIRVQASEGKVVFPSDPYDNYEKILNERHPLQSNRVRAIIFGNKETFKSKEFEIKVGVRLLCLVSANGKIEFLATIDNRQIDSYHYLPKLALFRNKSFSNPVILEGRELAPEHFFVVQHPETINPKNYILTYSNPQDDRIVRSEVDMTELYKLQSGQ
jgi:hypothetical protein